jgi:hypothetical protein
VKHLSTIQDYLDFFKDLPPEAHVHIDCGQQLDEWHYVSDFCVLRVHADWDNTPELREALYFRNDLQVDVSFSLDTVDPSSIRRD